MDVVIPDFEISSELDHGEQYLTLTCKRCNKEVDDWLGSMDLETIVNVANQHRYVKC